MSNSVEVDVDALFCASVLAPSAFSRNRFYDLFQSPAAQRARKRAKRLRGIIRQLLGHGREPADIVGELVLDDGRVLLRYTVRNLAYQRTTSLSPLEASVLRYALHRAGAAPLKDEDKHRVEAALARLAPDIDPNAERPSFLPSAPRPTD